MGASAVTDFLTALALVLVIEGLLYALFPEAMRRAIAALELDGATLRMAGLAAAVIGLLCVWLIRG